MRPPLTASVVAPDISKEVHRHAARTHAAAANETARWLDSGSFSRALEGDVAPGSRTPHRMQDHHISSSEAAQHPMDEVCNATK